MTMTTTTENIKVWVKPQTDGEGESPVAREHLWAATLSGDNNLVTIQNVAAMTNVCTLDDVVRYDPETRQVLEVIRRHRWGGLVSYPEPDADATEPYVYLNGYLEALGIAVEGMGGCVAAIAVPLGWCSFSVAQVVDRAGGRLIAYCGPPAPDASLIEMTMTPMATDEDNSQERKAEFGTNNVDCALRGQTILYTYARRTGVADEPFTTPLGDMLSDLMHLCRMNQVDFQAMVEKARHHHDEERDGIY